MSHSTDHYKPFSPLLFGVHITITLLALYAFWAVCFPQFTARQFQSFHALLWTALVLHLLNSFFEFFIHRYILHTPLIPGLGHFYKRHTLHHRLTMIVGKPVENETRLRARNIFPIERDVQHEASFFPWYSLPLFVVATTPVFLVLQWVLPHAPIVGGGYIAVVFSYVLYELVHAVEHMPPETTLRPLLGSRHFGKMWRGAYSFHLRHHADIYSNESISGFFCIPIPDILLKTLQLPHTLYRNGELVLVEEFQSPRPVWFIRWLDVRAERARRQYRKK